MLRRFVFKLGTPRAKFLTAKFERYLPKTGKLIDIGAGSCHVAAQLVADGFEILPVDIQDLSFTDSIKPVIVPEGKLPYEDGQFGAGLLITVLHHTPDPDALLREAARVADRVIVIEDVYKNRPHRYATYFMDSLMNLEFRGHPHSNRTDGDWQQTFKTMGLKLSATAAFKSYLVMHHRLYVLDRV